MLIIIINYFKFTPEDMRIICLFLQSMFLELITSNVLVYWFL